MSKEQRRREECRHAVLAFLAFRSSLKFPIDSILRRVNTDGGDFTESEIKDALTFLVSDKFVEFDEDALGATSYFQATSDGVRFHERHHSV